MIPHLLHQTWKSKDHLPDDFSFWRKSFFETNPGIESRLYDDRDNRALLGKILPALLPLYDDFPTEIFRVDFIRALYLFTDGGFYADLDFQCLASLGKISSEGDVVLGRMGTNDRFLHSIPNAFMAATPGQGFWLGYLAHIEKTWLARRGIPGIASRPDYITGPVVLRQAVSEYLVDPGKFRKRVEAFILANAPDVDPARVRFGPLTLLPGHVLYPLNWKDQIHRIFLTKRKEENRLYSVEQAKRLFPVSAAVTYWVHSWELPTRKALASNAQA